MRTDKPAAELPEAEFDAEITRSGFELTPIERENVLTTARYLRRAAALVRTYNAKTKSAEH